MATIRIEYQDYNEDGVLTDSVFLERELPEAMMVTDLLNVFSETQRKLGFSYTGVGVTCDTKINGENIEHWSDY